MMLIINKASELSALWLEGCQTCPWEFIYVIVTDRADAIRSKEVFLYITVLMLVMRYDCPNKNYIE